MRLRHKIGILAVVLVLVMGASALATTGVVNHAGYATGGANDPMVAGQVTGWYPDSTKPAVNNYRTQANSQNQYGNGDCAACDQQQERARDTIGVMDPQGCQANDGCEPDRDRMQQRMNISGNTLAPSATTPATPSQSPSYSNGCYNCGFGNTATGSGPAHSPSQGSSTGGMHGGMRMR